MDGRGIGLDSITAHHVTSHSEEFWGTQGRKGTHILVPVSETLMMPMTYSTSVHSHCDLFLVFISMHSDCLGGWLRG